MSLRVWLPLNGDTHNQGLMQLPTPTVNTFTFSNGGKIGGQSTSGSGKLAWHLTEDFLSNNKWTVATWIKATQTFSSANNIIFCKNTSASNDCQIYFSIVNGTSLVCGVNGPSSSLTTSYTFTVGTWYHVATTYNGSTVALYINGEQKATKTVTTAWPGEKLNMQLRDRSNNAAGTGSGGSAAAAYAFNDFRIYDHALSELEIKEIAKGLVLHYPLNHNGMGQSNLISNSYYNAEPWTSAITDTEVYKGKNAMIVQAKTLYQKTSSGTTCIFPLMTFKENTQYTISLDWCDHIRTDGNSTRMRLKFIYSDDTSNNIVSPDNSSTADWVHRTFTSTAGKTISAIGAFYGSSGVVSIANLKIEEGAQATNWAPPFDEENNIEYDISGYRNNGTKVGTFTYSTDTPKYGISTYISSGNINYITTPTLQLPGDQITMNFWFKSSNKDPGSSYHMPFEGTANSNQAYEMSIYKTGYLRGGLTIAGTRKVDNCTSTKLTDGNWHMCTMTYDGATIKRYVDATMEKSTSATGALATSSAFVIGHYGSNTSYYCKEAYISDVRLYTTALSAQDILSLYHNSALVDEQGIIHGAIH